MIDLNYLKFTAETTKAKYGGNCAVLVASDDVLDLLEQLEASQRDAARWRKARELLSVDEIERCVERAVISIPEEYHNLKADAAIDAAMAATKGEA